IIGIAIAAAYFVFQDFRKGTRAREVQATSPAAAPDSSAEGKGAAPDRAPPTESETSPGTASDRKNRTEAAASGAASEPYSPEGSTRKIRSGRVVYASSCRSCHGTGASGAPRLDDFEAWTSRLTRSTASLSASVIKGTGAMPARGGDRSLEDDEIR